MHRPIESYGIVGDLFTVALVGTDGSIDWCCLPHFDSPSVFARILDEHRGGFYRLAPVNWQRSRQMYLPDTNVLVTRFLSDSGVGEVVDFMPVAQRGQARRHQIVRIAKAVRGSVRFRIECVPAFDYARQRHTVAIHGTGALFDAGDMRLSLTSRFPLHCDGTGAITEFTLLENESTAFILQQSEEVTVAPTAEARGSGEQLMLETVSYWKRWLGQCTYYGRWGEMVQRSALTLKLLTYRPTGAIVAAPTTSLPEQIGGVRNWDYRFTWVRDAAFVLLAFLNLGFVDEAAGFFDWLERRAREGTSERPLRIMYGIDGRHDMTETELTHLQGYRDSRPVRIGNGAAHQLQLDIYGELLDALLLHDQHATPLSYDLWSHVRKMLEWVCRNWDQADEGIWEVRGGTQRFTHSTLQCWVALDRGLRLAARRSLPLDVDQVRSERDRIYDTLMTRSWDASRRTFVQHPGTDAVDASTLLMPLVGFLSPTDPRMLSTIEWTIDELVSDSLVYRYEVGRGADDGFHDREGTFNICTFWLVENLTAAGHLEDARFLFEKMLTYANHLGLYAEETGPLGEALGNFPQAYTHQGLIRAALRLDKALEGDR